MKKPIVLFLLFINTSLLWPMNVIQLLRTETMPFIMQTFHKLIMQHKTKNLFFEQIDWRKAPTDNDYNEQIIFSHLCSAVNILITFPLFYYISHAISKKATTALTKKTFKETGNFRFLFQVSLQKIGIELFGNALLCTYFTTVKLWLNSFFYEKPYKKKTPIDQAFERKKLRERFLNIRYIIKNLIIERSDIRTVWEALRSPVSLNRLNVGKDIYQLYKLLLTLSSNILFKKSKEQITKKTTTYPFDLTGTLYVVIINGRKLPIIQQAFARVRRRLQIRVEPPSHKKKSNIELFFRPIYSKLPTTLLYFFFKSYIQNEKPMSKTSIKCVMDYSELYFFKIISSTIEFVRILYYLTLINTKKRTKYLPGHYVDLLRFFSYIVEKKAENTFPNNSNKTMFLTLFKEIFIILLSKKNAGETEEKDRIVILNPYTYRYFYKATPLNNNSIKTIYDQSITWSNEYFKNNNFFQFIREETQGHILTLKKNFNRYDFINEFTKNNDIEEFLNNSMFKNNKGESRTILQKYFNYEVNNYAPL